MSEQEFENYLLLLSKFMGLTRRQRESIASELRDHMEQRLDDLQSQGVPHEEAIRIALEEFGDASHLAHELSNVARDRKRRWMMKVTTGSLAAAVLAVIGTMAFWPNDSNDSVFAPSNAHAEQRDGATDDGNPPQGETPRLKSDAISFSNESLDASAAVIRKNLTQKCDLEFDDNPLSDVAAFVRELLGRPVIIDTHSLDELGISADATVSCQLNQVTLEAGLGLILDELDLTTAIANESLVITTPDRAAGQLTTRFYPVWDLVRPIGPQTPAQTTVVATRSSSTSPDFDTLIDIITSSVSPDSWDDVGGEGTIQGYKGMLVVSNTDGVHRRIERLVDQLRRFPLFSESLSEGAALSMAIGDEAAKIKQTLENRTTVDFQDTPLSEVIGYFKEITNLNFAVNRNAFDEVGVTLDQPVSLVAKDVSTRSALVLALRPLDLTYVVENGFIQITTPDDAAGKLQTRCHDVRGVVDFPSEFDEDRLQTEFDTLHDLIVATIATDSWDDVGGDGSIAAFPRKGVIVCSNTLEVHNELDAFLKVSRQVRETSRHSAPHDANAIANDASTLKVYIFTVDVKAEEIADMIRELIASGSSKDGTFVKSVQHRLIVRHNRHVHSQIRGLLSALRIDAESQMSGMGGGMF